MFLAAGRRTGLLAGRRAQSSVLVSDTVPGADSGVVVVVGGNASPGVGGLVGTAVPDEGRVTPGFGVGRYARGESSARTVVASAS